MKLQIIFWFINLFVVILLTINLISKTGDIFTEIYRIVSQKQINDSQNNDVPSNGQEVDVPGIVLSKTATTPASKQQGCCKSI